MHLIKIRDLMPSDIEWLRGGETWNPIRARHKTTGKVGWQCVHASPGCVNCYAETMNVSGRFLGTKEKYTVQGLNQVEMFLDEKILNQPLHWRKPRLIFPCSMTDWMGDFITPYWNRRMIQIMQQTPQHTYLTLTKRADRQRERLTDLYIYNHFNVGIPLPNHWVGVSVENQEWLNKRTYDHLMTPAWLRWLSCEPLLGPLDLTDVRFKDDDCDISLNSLTGRAEVLNSNSMDIISDEPENPRYEWIVLGFESGAKARPGHPNWARKVRDDCNKAGVPFFFKQWGSYSPMSITDKVKKVGMCSHCGFNFPVTQAGAEEHSKRCNKQAMCMYRVGKKTSGNVLDGHEHKEYPKVES